MKYNITEKHIDLFRDSAIALEKIDIEKSIQLMELAHEIRPSGQVIKKKLAIYKKQLKSVETEPIDNINFDI